MPVPHDESDDDYFNALGVFVDAFAKLEYGLLKAMAFLMNVPMPIALAVLSGSMRSDTARKFILRLLTAKKVGDEVRADFEELFIQLGHITKLRNNLLHYGSRFVDIDSNDMLVTNRHIALTEDNIMEVVVSVRDLANAHMDITAITYRLAILLGRFYMPPEVFQEWYNDPMMRTPWLYTPPPQASQRGKPPRQPRKRPRPPSPSRA